jgi:hypothetical protein
MQGITQQFRELGAVVEFLPQPADAFTRLENVTVDPATFGWSTRVGFEKYRPNPAFRFEPFHNLGPIDSLFVFEQLPGGRRYSILFESGGTLYLFWEVGAEGVLFALQAGRTVPAPGEAASQYTVVGDAVLVTNGRDTPVVVRPWPLPDRTYVATAVGVGVVRPLGWTSKAPSPDLLDVQTITSAAGAPAASSDTVTGDSVTLWWPDGRGAIRLPKAYGLGFANNTTSADGQAADFRYRVSFLMENGSESPLSDEVAVSWVLEGNTEGFRYCVAMRLPLGPPGVVARRVYRTQNTSVDSPTYGDTDLYLLDTVRNNTDDLWFDPYRSTAVGALAPALTESIPLPSPRAGTAAVFQDCLFLDGGPEDPNTLYFSHPGLPDQFGAASYIRLAAPGGAVVRLFSHYRVLVVLRENGVDVVSGDFTNGFQATTVTSQVACRSPHTVDQVPGLGVVFLAQDGVYALQGGFDGGSEMQVLRLSEPIKRTLRRLTPDCAARAVGRYSPMDRAYHLYVPVDGNDRPNLGVVFHTEKEGWSTRTGFPVGSLDRLHNGQLIFGHNTGSAPGNDDPAGLFVISGRRAMGGSIVGDAYVENGPPTSIIKTAWLDLGDAQLQKRVQYATLWAMTTGSVNITAEAYKDFQREGLACRPYLAQPPDAANLPVYDSATIGTDVWEDTQLVPLRIGVAQQSCAWFALEVSTTDDLLLVGWEVEYRLPGTNTIAGKRG